MAINTRSPYYTSTAIVGTSYSTLDIYIWTGENNASTPIIYSLKKYALSGSIIISYEVSELIRDYLDVTFD